MMTSIRLLLITIVAYIGQAAAWSNATMQAAFMRRAIVLAKEAAKEQGGSPFGCVIVQPATATILAEGKNHDQRNPIWHGEMAAITNLSSKVPDIRSIAPSLELYSTAEPCSMCASAIAWAGFGRILYGTSIPFMENLGVPQTTSGPPR